MTPLGERCNITHHTLDMDLTMKRRFNRLCLAAVLATPCLAFGWQAPARPDAADDEVQVLTRGPVHEAFAETVTFDPEPGFVAPRAPPEAIEELPPAHRPQGDNVAWIPGYFAWDDDREDFLWVSGIWRALPPGREWVPGYWVDSRQGAQWTPGYWADAQSTETEYLPEPPASAEAGPNIEQPSPDHNWAPGSWIWQQNRYVWRPGFWTPGYADWDWVPAYYVWSPGGYVFVDGYWDYNVERRGVLFAPVYFNRNVYGRRGYSYSPTTVISLSGFFNHLFLRPNYQHYYFGDYYGANYAGNGYYPWFAYSTSGYGYDPFYAHQRWHHRNDRDWSRRVQASYEHRRDHEDARPAHTWREQQERRRDGRRQDDDAFVAVPFDEVTKEQADRFRPVDDEERQNHSREGRRVWEFRDARRDIEVAPAEADVKPPVATEPTADPPATERHPTRRTRPRSPVVGRPAEELDVEQAPPQRFEAPQPDPEVKPQPRRTREQRDTRSNDSRRQPQTPANNDTRRNQREDNPRNQNQNAPRDNPPRGSSQDQPRGESQSKPDQQKGDKPDQEKERKPRQ